VACPNRVTSYIRHSKYSSVEDNFQLDEEENWSSDSANDEDEDVYKYDEGEEEDNVVTKNCRNW
jgi:hypothetical protein